MYGRFRQLYLRSRDRELGQNGRESKPAFAPLIRFNLANSWPRGPRPGNSITKRERANRAIVAAKEKEFSGTGVGGEGRGGAEGEIAVEIIQLDRSKRVH